MKLTIQRMARIAILSALAVGLRSAFIGLPNIQPITAMFFVSVLYLGLVDGFLIMALTMSISGFIFGFGPWVFNQILAFGILMALWSLIAPRLSLVWQIALVTILSFLYGVLLDYSYGLLFKSGLTFVVSGLLYDTYHAVSTLLFYPFIQSIFRRLLKWKIIDMFSSCLFSCYFRCLWKNESAKPTSSTNNHQSKGQGQVTLILKTEKESKKNP